VSASTTSRPDTSALRKRRDNAASRPIELQVNRFRDRFFRHRERLGEHAHRFQLRRHAHGERLAVDHEFGLVSVEAPDATLGVQARPAHIGPIHGARPTCSTAAANREHGIVTRLDQRHRAADVHDLAEHFVAEHKVLVGGLRLGAATRGLLAVGAADAHAQHAEFDVVRCHDRRFRPINELDRLRSRDDGDGFHASAFRRSGEPPVSTRVGSRNSARICSTIAAGGCETSTMSASDGSSNASNWLASISAFM